MVREKKMIRTAIILGCSMVALASLPGCVAGEARADTAQLGSAVGEGEAKASGIMPRNVVVEKLVPGTLTEYVSGNGITKPVKETTYSAEIGGRIGKLTADLGDRVKRGQVLARIDRAALGAQAEQARASFDLAASTFDRMAELKNEDLVSQQSFDEANAQKLGTKAGLTAARVNLSKSAVRSNHKGIVTAKYMDEAEYAGPGSPLYTVMDLSEIIVEAQLAESQVAGIVPGTKAMVEIGAMYETFEGTVETLVPAADPMSKTFTLRVKVSNPDERILAGMSAKVRIQVAAHSDALVVTQSSVVEERDAKSVFVVDGDTARRRTVTTGAIEGDRVVVLTGLEPGETIVVTGQRELTDGQPVVIVD